MDIYNLLSSVTNKYVSFYRKLFLQKKIKQAKEMEIVLAFILAYLLPRVFGLAVLKLHGLTPLITDPPLTSSTPLSKQTLFIYRYESLAN